MTVQCIPSWLVECIFKCSIVLLIGWHTYSSQNCSTSHSSIVRYNSSTTLIRSFSLVFWFRYKSAWFPLQFVRKRHLLLRLNSSRCIHLNIFDGRNKIGGLRGTTLQQSLLTYLCTYTTHIVCVYLRTIDLGWVSYVRAFGKHHYHVEYYQLPPNV